MRKPSVPAGALLCVTLTAGTLWAANPVQSLLDGYARQAGVSSLSAAAGDKFFHEQHAGGNPDITSCTVCHTANPRNWGQTRVGKAIAPMALSVTHDRFSDPAKVEKWLGRNCNVVLGRECTAEEKGDVIAYLSSQ
jgi:hypothetical protein